MIDLQALKRVLIDHQCDTPELLATVAQSVQAFALIAIAERLEAIMHEVTVRYRGTTRNAD